MNINEMMKQAKKMQIEMEKKQKELENRQFFIKKQGLELVMNGDKTIKSINIDEILIDPEDKELLEDILIIAINEGISKINEEEEKNKPNSQGGM